ncbi:hypothetical protein HC026_09575 [Lactobacillus sp. LC28-10]|uniref:Surface layer protein A domain-containing protein n=1 Tax=Secundilactobacillus angelensis TaxID=2722706 RepID=A0ABX1L0W0_9LACO|nr:hypothetical protein [Secundilactobacillus angelensis]MCH5463232.1 hypothetical protein [Secundilactobacillus angelensis]NLR19160.1 hypothetical protein [Secundilactobacillus angelensis]
MNKFITTQIAIAIGLVSGTMIISPNVQAATWHKGTPKAIRGNWRHYTTKNGQYTHNIGKSVIWNGNGPWATRKETKIRYYKYNAHYYRVQGIYPGTEFHPEVKLDYLIARNGKTLKLISYNKFVKNHHQTTGLIATYRPAGY